MEKVQIKMNNITILQNRLVRQETRLNDLITAETQAKQQRENKRELKSKTERYLELCKYKQTDNKRVKGKER